MRACGDRWIRYAGICLGLWLMGILVGCPLQRLTGIPCPACGMSRAWSCVLHFQFRQALQYHPLFWLAPWLVDLIFRDSLYQHPAEKKYRQWSLAIVSTAMIAVYLWRVFLVPHGPVGIHLENGVVFHAVAVMRQYLVI